MWGFFLISALRKIPCVPIWKSKYLNNRFQPWARCVWKANAQLLNTHHTKTYISVPLGRRNRHTLIYIYMEITCDNKLNRLVERELLHRVLGPTLLSSLPGDGFLNLGFKSQRYSRGTVFVFVFCFLCKWCVLRSPFCTGTGFLDRFPSHYVPSHRLPSHFSPFCVCVRVVFS